MARMTRRRFLTLSGLALGAAANWRVGYDFHSTLIPAGADAVCEKQTLAPLVDYQRLSFATPREAALYAMQAVHRAVPYGVAPSASTVDEFLRSARADCGTYARVQDQVCKFYGLTTRRVCFDNLFHGWMEVWLDGNWEIFDATSCVWINQPMEALLTGVPRQYSMYYSPIFDPTAPEIFRAHLREGWNVPALRARLPYLGLERGAQFAALETF